MPGEDINKIMDFVIEHQKGVASGRYCWYHARRAKKGVASKIQGDIARIMPEEPKEVVLEGEH